MVQYEMNLLRAADIRRRKSEERFGYIAKDKRFYVAE